MSSVNYNELVHTGQWLIGLGQNRNPDTRLCFGSNRLKRVDQCLGVEIGPKRRLRPSCAVSMVSPVASAVDHDMELDSEALRQLRCRGKVNKTVSETSSRCELVAARAGRVVRFLDMYVVKKAKEVLRGIEREVEGLSQMEPSGSIRRAVPAGWGACRGDGRPALLLPPCPALPPPAADSPMLSTGCILRVTATPPPAPACLLAILPRIDLRGFSLPLMGANHAANHLFPPGPRRNSILD